MLWLMNETFKKSTNEKWSNNNNIYDYIWKIATGQWDNYATGCLLD